MIALPSFSPPVGPHHHVPEEADALGSSDTRAQVLLFAAHDPLGASGLAADALSIATFGAHMHGICTGVFARDSLGVHDFYPVDAEAFTEQVSLVLQDSAIDAIHIGFLGTLAHIQHTAEFISDYPDMPVVVSFEDLSWWEAEQIEDYLDAFASLILPMTHVLVGPGPDLSRWLLNPSHQRASDNLGSLCRELSAQLLRQFNQASSLFLYKQSNEVTEYAFGNAQSTLLQQQHRHAKGLTMGLHSVLASAYSALIAQDYSPTNAASEAIAYAQQTLKQAFKPGMGPAIPDRLPSET